MPTNTVQPEADTPVLTPWRISSARYIQMIRDGVFGEDDRVELIDGMIVEMSPPSPEHDYNVVRFLDHLRPPVETAQLGPNVVIEVGEGQIYQPDFVLLKPGRVNKQHYPKAEDVLLIAETAKTSLAKDRGPKLRAYAAAGVADYWIADVERERLLVHREPVGNEYKRVSELTGEDEVVPLLLRGVDGVTVRVGDLFE
jgi:Uma2 family endonuclease